MITNKNKAVKTLYILKAENIQTYLLTGCSEQKVQVDDSFSHKEGSFMKMVERFRSAELPEEVIRLVGKKNLKVEMFDHMNLDCQNVTWSH